MLHAFQGLLLIACYCDHQDTILLKVLYIIAKLNTESCLRGCSNCRLELYNLLQSLKPHVVGDVGGREGWKEVGRELF